MAAGAEDHDASHAACAKDEDPEIDRALEPAPQRASGIRNRRGALDRHGGSRDTASDHWILVLRVRNDTAENLRAAQNSTLSFIIGAGLGFR